MRKLALIFFIFTLASPAHATEQVAERAAQLDRLFGELHPAVTKREPDKIIADIWQIWGRNDSPTAEWLIREGTAAMNAGEFDAAEKVFIQLIESYPNFAEGWNKRATLYYMVGRYDASLVDIQHVLDLEPRHFGALAGKAAILRAQGKTKEALAVLREVLVINPHMASAIEAIKELEKTQPDI
ncbi:MAG: tetratricopeptide repeat protein [Alphaproteobacteria bacterium]|nr:tetratricopeptide repeat protein [Alphaproteobacteria bacterium]